MGDACASPDGRSARSASSTGCVRVRAYEHASLYPRAGARGQLSPVPPDGPRARARGEPDKLMTTLPPVDRAQLIATRRDLHQHPELGFEERRTSGLVAERLERLGYAVRTGVGKTGVVGLRDGAAGAEARCVLIRADMDALPIEEANDGPYRSQHAGKMHACGHDAHVAIGIEVA